MEVVRFMEAAYECITNLCSLWLVDIPVLHLWDIRLTFDWQGIELCKNLLVFEITCIYKKLSKVIANISSVRWKKKDFTYNNIMCNAKIWLLKYFLIDSIIQIYLLQTIIIPTFINYFGYLECTFEINFFKSRKLRYNVEVNGMLSQSLRISYIHMSIQPFTLSGWGASGWSTENIIIPTRKKRKFTSVPKPVLT